MFHCVFHCAFHCVTQRRARFTVRFTAFHSAARISLQPRVCRGKFPISNAIKSSSGPVNLQRVCENHPSLERKACKRLTTSLLAQHYETLLRDGLRCRCLIITSNSNSVFSSRASCQNQAHQLGPGLQQRALTENLNGRETGPQGGTGFRLLRAQFWTLAQSKYISEGTQKWTLLGSKVVLLAGPFLVPSFCPMC